MDHATRKSSGLSSSPRIHKIESFPNLALRCRVGLSHSTRYRDWKRLFGYDGLHGVGKAERELRKKRYHQWLKCRNRLNDDFTVSECHPPTLIDLDVARTKQNHPFFSGGKDYSSSGSSNFSSAQQALRRILCTACWQDTDDSTKKAKENSLHSSSKETDLILSSVNNDPLRTPSHIPVSHFFSYVQGMNEIAAVLLFAFCGGDVTQLTDKIETDAFWCFMILMRWTNPGTFHEKTQVFMALLHDMDEDLYAHVQGINPEIFPSVGTRWMAVQFSQNFLLEDCLLLWDFIFSFGQYFLCATLYLGCGICVAQKEVLLESKEMSIVMNALNLTFDSAIVKPILKTTTNLMLKYPFSVFLARPLKILPSPVLTKDKLVVQ